MEKNKDLKKAKKIAEDVVKEMASLMGVDIDFSVEEDEKNEAILINIDAKDETGLLIGSRGSTVKSLQLVLGMIISRRLGAWQRVIVNVADWMEQQKEKYESMADKAAERALETGEPQQIYNLGPSERRIIHLRLSERDDIVTESVGEGSERYLLVKPA